MIKSSDRMTRGERAGALFNLSIEFHGATPGDK